MADEQLGGHGGFAGLGDEPGAVVAGVYDGLAVGGGGVSACCGCGSVD